MDADRYVQRAQANVGAWLAMLRLCEVGTTAEIGYRALFGFHPERNPERVFESYAQHPNIRFEFRWTNGTIGYTTAAGAYQFIYSTWQSVATPLGLTNFSPQNQDRAAIELTHRRKALLDVEAGRLQEAIDKCWPEWASLPASRYAQPTRSIQFCCNAFAEAGGVIT